MPTHRVALWDSQMSADGLSTILLHPTQSSTLPVPPSETCKYIPGQIRVFTQLDDHFVVRLSHHIFCFNMPQHKKV